MTVLADSIAPNGALVRVLVGIGASQRQKLRTAFRPIPQAVSLDALLDIGAETTCYDSQAVRALGLEFDTIITLNAPALGGFGLVSIEKASLTIVHPSGNPADDLVIPGIGIIDLPLNTLGYQLLLGRDVLNRCRLVYDGPAGTFTLEY
jgi:hypothetical protein